MPTPSAGEVWAQLAGMGSVCINYIIIIHYSSHGGKDGSERLLVTLRGKGAFGFLSPDCLRLAKIGSIKPKTVICQPLFGVQIKVSIVFVGFVEFIVMADWHYR